MGAEELTTGDKFFLLLTTNDLKSIVTLPMFTLLLPSEPQIYMQKLPLFRYLKKKSSSVTLKLNYD